MSVKEIKDAMEKGKVYFGIRETLKNKKKIKKVFLCKDTRESTIEKIKSSGLEYSIIKQKSDVARELNLNFESEVYSIE